MGRGVSSGGGQSSLGYLFGSGEAPAPKPATNNGQALVEKPAQPQLLVWYQRSSVLLHHLLHHLVTLQSRFLLVSREIRRITITVLMARTLGTSSRIDLLLKSMRPQVVDLPWDTSLEVAATSAFGSSNSTTRLLSTVSRPHSKWGLTICSIFSS